MKFATAVPTKGASGKFAVDKGLEFIQEVGDASGKIIIKNDQEPSMKYFINDLVEAREEGRSLLEESPVKSSGSNGVVERGVQSVEGHVRAIFLAFQDRLGVKIDTRERIVTFIPEYAAYLLNRLEVGRDGKVAYERVKGKKPTVLGIEFGEKLMYKVKPKNKLEKINARWEYGIFVGVRRRSGEVWIAAKDKIISARSVRRIPIEHRWSKDCVNWVSRVPWNRYKDAEDADGEVPEGVPVDESAAGKEEKSERIIFVETKERAPREFYIKKGDAEVHGYTRGCGGCSSWFRGLGRQPHTEECRKRFKALMKDDARVKNAETRKAEFEQRAQEKKRRKDEKKEERRKRKSDQDFEEEEEMAKRHRDEQEADVGGGMVKLMVSGKRSREDEEEAEEMDTNGVWEKIDGWVCEVVEDMREEEFEDEIAWDDVHGGELPLKEVIAARKEEVEYMQQRRIWEVVPIAQCWDTTGKDPVSVRWVDVNKGGLEKWEVRSRLVARDFKGRDKDRDDLFAETPPLEGKRMLLSRAATRRLDGRQRKLLFIDARKAHLNPKCENDVFIELPQEVEGGPGVCGKLRYWLYGFRPAAAAWEKLYASKLEQSGFRRGVSCGVVFFHPERDIACVVHGDDFTFCACHEELLWIRRLMESWFEIKVRAMLGPDDCDSKEVSILGRLVRWTIDGIEYKADPKHRNMIMEYFGLNEQSKPLPCNGEKEWRTEEAWEEEELLNEEATVFRGLTARANFLSLDCPDLQFPVKEMSREMANPKQGSWKRLKKIARYLLGREEVTWKFEWQDEPKFCHVCTDSDWGGRVGSRKSTSGGVWMLGSHCTKTWSCTQGAYALSSAEAEFYAMIEGVTRAKGLLNLAKELGFTNIENVIHLGTDSSAAKSFVCRRGLGKMKHLEIRDLWLQKEVSDGKLVVSKVKGVENPADLMTKILGWKEIQRRLKDMSLVATFEKFEKVDS